MMTRYNLEQFSKFVKVHKNKQTKQGKYAVIYTRVSSKEQADTGNSLESQLKYCEQFAERHGFEVLEYFGGTYESAKGDERKEFKKMLEFVKRQKAKVSTIIVYSYDRFSRTGGNAIYLNDQLEQIGISVSSCIQPTDTSTSAGKFNRNMQYLFSKYDNDQRREKSVTGMLEALRRGQWVSKPPIGYERAFVNGQRCLAIDKNGKLLRQAFLMKCKEGLSNTAIIAKLNSMGLRLSNQMLTHIFRNPFYCGIITNKLLGEELIRGKHEPLISEEIFFQVNDIQSANPQGYQVQLEDENLPLKQHIRCANSGAPFTGYEVKKKGLHYYKCNKVGCKCNKSAKIIHETYLDLLKQYQVNKELIPVLKEALSGVFTERHENSKQQAKLIQQQATERDKKLEALEERFVFGEVPKELYEKFSQKLKQERRETEAHLASLTGPLSNHQKFIEMGLKLSVTLCESWSIANFNEKQRLQSLIFPEGVYYDRKIQGYRTPRVNAIFKLSASFNEHYKLAKKEKTSPKTGFSNLVGPLGIEPFYSYLSKMP
ncbi:recombinase family protein [Adhaeribacter soli]|uniref:Recombinase family protein n=1 Tax=Adhaeribacter soli TaxID=2607655 RepID=A0A5N1J325_9BACT|nr:recombinase family protein [Adhaeribacter soli]KAA9338953.1 recombinase family protein [Adhaeribacter soli]